MDYYTIDNHDFDSLMGAVVYAVTNKVDAPIYGVVKEVCVADDAIFWDKQETPIKTLSDASYYYYKLLKG